MTWNIDVENVSGILRGTATLEKGPNAVRASNWQGKSSFIDSIATGLGVATPLTEGKDSGQVQLQTPDRDVVVELVRENGSVIRRGQPFLEDEYDRIRADLFACLGETNEIRQTVRRGENLEEVLLRPLDVERIEERITEHKAERERITAELAQAREAEKQLPKKVEAVNRLEAELDELQEKHEELTGEGDSSESSAARTELAQARSDRDQAENRIQRLERSIERTEARLEEKRAELDAIDVEPTADIEAELERARDRLQEVKRDSDILESIYSAHEMALSDGRLDLLTDVQRELSGDTVVCWTCGSETPRAELESRLDEFGERIADLRAKQQARRDEVETLETRREELRQGRRRKQDLETEISNLEETLADHRQSLAETRERYESATERVETLSETVDEAVEEIASVESDIKYRKAELTEAREELSELETRAEQVELLESSKAEIDSDIEDLRERKDRIEHETRNAFDEAISDVLDRFDTGFETARLTAGFDLVVARDGRTASLDALSEGELELLGIVAALAGFEAFEVGKTVPIILLDGVGALDDDNLHTLIEYLTSKTDYLVFTVYPEYADFTGNDIDPSQWELATGTDTTQPEA